MQLSASLWPRRGVPAPVPAGGTPGPTPGKTAPVLAVGSLPGSGPGSLPGGPVPRKAPPRSTGRAPAPAIGPFPELKPSDVFLVLTRQSRKRCHPEAGGIYWKRVEMLEK